MCCKLLVVDGAVLAEEEISGFSLSVPVDLKDDGEIWRSKLAGKGILVRQRF